MRSSASVTVQIVSCLLFALLLAPSAQSQPAGAHFVQTDGKPWERFEPVWEGLRKVYGDAMPPRVTIAVFDEGSGGNFDTEHNTINLTRSFLDRMGAELVAHETSHLCLAVLTRGASATEPFRFMDEGLAEILGRRSVGKEDDYRRAARLAAATEATKNGLSLEKVQRWSEFFGDWQTGPGQATGRPRNWGAYLVGASFDFYVIDRYGEAALTRLLADIGNSKDLGASLTKVLGRTVAEAQADWRAYVAEAPSSGRETR